MLNLPYEFYDYLEHSVEEWVYDYSLADRYRMERDRMKAWIFWRLQCLSGLWSGTRN